MSGIYIHIPFCKQACNYCNFHFSTSLSQKDDLLKAILKEIELNKNYLDDTTIETIYIGGGTPSLLSTDEINKIIETIDCTFKNHNWNEITLEANPDDISIEYLKLLKHTPVNRLSIGVQSFFNKDLRYMNRAHNAKEAEYAVKAAQDKGFENISIDLIYGTPGMTNNEWIENIAITNSLMIPHVSAYALTVEPKTALHYAVSNGKTTTPDATQATEQFDLLMYHMKLRGFDHYEISNFALRDKYAVHNTNYWKGKSYLGVGPSAHSYNGYSRQWNIANNALYIKSVLQEDKIVFEKELLSRKNQINEYIMTTLRTMWGLDLNYVSSKFGISERERITAHSKQLLNNGNVFLEGNVIKLTQQGKHFADAIAAALFVDDTQ